MALVSGKTQGQVAAVVMICSKIFAIIDIILIIWFLLDQNQTLIDKVRAGFSLGLLYMFVDS